MSNVEYISDFLSSREGKTREEMLTFLRCLLNEVETSEVEGFMLVTWPGDLRDMRFAMMNLCDLDVMESIGLLEVIKQGVSLATLEDK